ncbi:hypothetical protein OKJ99_24470 [Streptomyces endophyticus]|uniref:Uncharacterized protein n=2 Tax=Streptomyces endophyticus TaxID=714166 RepID=A0ABU6F9E7_9ACTN|nr:hypothetical protein [Streptomyces endophyticus]MEB8340655.1 hypothetical protein [Streptomyces endophyticus]
MPGTAVRDEHPPTPQERSLDQKGGPGHTLLLALALAIPAVKVAYTVGGGEPARDVFVGMELSNWPDVLIGMLLTEPALGSVLGVVVSRVVFALFAARGAVPKGSGVAQAARRVALTVVNPVAVGIIAACFYGPWWGLGTGIVAYGLRQGVVVEYRAGRRGRRHHQDDYVPGRWLGRFAAAEQWVSLALTVVVLPLLAFGSAVDGKAWTSVLECQVQEGTRNTSQRLIELGRKGNGVVGWSLDTEEVVNGVGCVDTGSLRVRRAWW